MGAVGHWGSGLHGPGFFKLGNNAAVALATVALRSCHLILFLALLWALHHLFASLPWPHCRTAALVCNALRAQRTGDDSNARIQLTKALKAAHAHLGNTQMVAQVGCPVCLIGRCAWLELA